MSPLNPFRPRTTSTDPASLLAAYDLPGGTVNINNFTDPQITAALEQARRTANPDRRAALVAKAEKLTAYLFSPWANQLGGTG